MLHIAIGVAAGILLAYTLIHPFKRWREWRNLRNWEKRLVKRK